jgi:hypothetical protein
MEYLIVSYRSRSHTVKFHEFLRHNNIYSEIINTPKEAGVGCGLSVKISNSSFSRVKQLTFALGYNSFAGFFSVKNFAGKRLVRSI